MPIFNNIGSDKDQLNKNVFNLWVLPLGRRPDGPEAVALREIIFFFHARFVRGTGTSEKRLILLSDALIYGASYRLLIILEIPSFSTATLKFINRPKGLFAKRK